MTSFAQNGLLLDVQHVTMRFGGITAVNDLSMRIPTGPSPGSSAPTARARPRPSTSSAASTTPRKATSCSRPQREGLPPAPDLQAGMARTFHEYPALRQRNRAGKRHGRLPSPPQKPVVDAHPQPAQRPARGRGNPRKGEGLIHRLALDSYINEKASSLPYGAQRRLEIARALATSRISCSSTNPRRG